MRAVHEDAFPADESESVAALAVELIERGSELSVVSLVAVLDGDVVGHVVFSPVTRDGDPDWRGAILSPLAVSTRHHGTGVGSQIVNAGLRMLEKQGVGVVLVYGDPGYYGRFGFSAAEAGPFLPPHPLEMLHGWQARVGKGEQVGDPARLTVVEPLDKPELW